MPPHEAKQCPACGSQMIRRYADQVFLTHPPQYRWYWWCGCGRTEAGGTTWGKTEDEIAREGWERLNGKGG